MNGRCARAGLCAVVWAIAALWGTIPSVCAAGDAVESEPLQEVTVTARKQIDQRTLEHVIIPRFVRSHGTPSPKSHQIGRWIRPGSVCPSTTGLTPASAEYVSRRIISVATSVGAPTAEYGHCNPTVEIIFTSNPQEEVNYFGKTYRALLGYDGGSLRELLTFSHQIRAWYSTATHTERGWFPDSDQLLVNAEGRGGLHSRLSGGMTSGFVNVLVIADAKQISDHSLRSIADLIAMLVLTRTSLDGCSDLPSIVDLQSADCSGRIPPDSMTAADIAYLKALYTVDPERNLNIEQGDMRSRMSREMSGR
jgi:hypothetical protein